MKNAHRISRATATERQIRRLEGQVSTLHQALSKATEMLRIAFGEQPRAGRDVLKQCQRVLGKERVRLLPIRKRAAR
jgi:hypothetical protein